MNNIPSHSLATAASHRQDTLSDSQFSNYIRKQSVSAHERLDSGLTIQTKEGDLVTLTSSSYARMDSFMYDSRGMLTTESGTTAVTQNIREVTLASGESFSFSVVGDLSEEELADIESIVTGIDEIAAEMAAGDMDDAVAKALSMGSYDTVSMYSADISYQKSYAMTSEIQAEEASIRPSVSEQFAGNHRSRRRKNNSIQNIAGFFERMAQQLEKQDAKLVEKSRKPLEKLFEHHLENEKNAHGRIRPNYSAIKSARNKVADLIDRMTEKMVDRMTDNPIENQIGKTDNGALA